MITYSLETLHHFQCQSCKQGWSIGDWTPADSMICLRCGKHQPVEPCSQPGADTQLKHPE